MLVNPDRSLVSKIDHYLDYIPVASTFINITHLFQKCIVQFLSEQIQKSHYFQLVKNKPLLRCVTVLFPFLGNIAVALYDFYQGSQKIKVGNRSEIEGLLDIPKPLPLKNEIVERKVDLEIFKQAEALLKSDTLKDKTEEALKLCTEAAEVGEPRFIYELGLYFDKNKNYEKAHDCFLKGASRDHKESFFSLGYSFEKGLAGEADKKQALEWYQKGALLGSTACLDIMGHNYLKGNGVEKDVDKAILYFNKVFENGQFWIMGIVGFKFLEGRDLPKNEKEAFNCFQSGANKGDLNCMYYLSDMYFKGSGVPQDPELGMKYLSQAAEKGHQDSAYKLGIKLIKTDPAKSCYWFELAAKKGHLESIYQLGWTYAFGSGKNTLKGIEWFELGARKNHERSICDLGMAYAKLNKAGQGTEETISKEFEWLTKGAQLKNSACLYNLSSMYDKGRGVTVDKAKATSLLKAAADQGYAAAMFLLGVRLVKSKPPQIELGYDYLTKAAKNKHAEAYYKLGEMLCDANSGLKQNIALGEEYYEMAVKMNHFPAMFRLGKLYLSRGIHQNVDKAFSLLKRAAEKVPAAMYLISTMYENGEGVEQNREEALEWLDKAVNCNVGSAMYKMGKLYEKAEILYLDKFDLHKPQLTRNKELAAPDFERAYNLYERAKNAGVVEAYFDLGIYYLLGMGTAVDINKAIENLIKAGDNEPTRQNKDATTAPYANFILGKIYLCRGSEMLLDSMHTQLMEGATVKLEGSPDYELAIHYFNKSKISGYCPPHEELVKLYFEGPKVVQDYDKCIQELEKDAYGLTRYLVSIAKLVESGDFVPKDGKTAEDLYRLAAKNADQDAIDWVMRQGDLNVAFELGIALERINKEKAMAVYEKGAELGHKQSMQRLIQFYQAGYGGEKSEELAQKWLEKAAAVAQAH